MNKSLFKDYRKCVQHVNANVLWLVSVLSRVFFCCTIMAYFFESAFMEMFCSQNANHYYRKKQATQEITVINYFFPMLVFLFLFFCPTNWEKHGFRIRARVGSLIFFHLIGRIFKTNITVDQENEFFNVKVFLKIGRQLP